MSVGSTLTNRATKAQETVKKFQKAKKLTDKEKQVLRNRAKRRRQGRL